MPRSFRGEHPDGYPPPESMNAYQPPSVIAPYKGVAMVFAILLVALAVYFIKSLRPAHHPSPPPAQSVYVEVVPASAASASP